MQLLDSDDSTSDEDVFSVGSRRVCLSNIEGERELGALRLFNDYFSADPTYPPHIFERRFRICRDTFERVWLALEAKYLYFQQQQNGTRKMEFSFYHKCIATVCMLAYGISSNMLDEYLRMAESTAMKCIKIFAKVVVEFFRDDVFSPPNK